MKLTHTQAMRLKETKNLSYCIRWIGGRGNVAQLEPKGEEAYVWCLREIASHPQAFGWKIVGEPPAWLAEVAS